MPASSPLCDLRTLANQQAANGIRCEYPKLEERIFPEKLLHMREKRQVPLFPIAESLKIGKASSATIILKLYAYVLLIEF